MRRAMLGLAACGCLLLPSSARAQSDQPPQLQQTQRSDETKKHLGAVDLYLKDSMNNARQLYQMSALSTGYLDAMLIREDVANLDRALSNADKHLSQVRTLPNARMIESGRIEALQRDLSQARAQIQSLRTTAGNVDRAQLREASTNLFQSLHRADDELGHIAAAVGLTRVDQINVTERQPVRGLDRELDMNSPRIHGPATDSGLGTGSVGPEHSMSPDRAVPTPQTPESTSPEQGAWPRY